MADATPAGPTSTIRDGMRVGRNVPAIRPASRSPLVPGKEMA
jgi:hypothetical protein